MSPRPGRTRRGPRRVAVAAVAAALLLAGCSGSLPTDPVPRAGLPVDVQPRQDVERVLPRPQPDASNVEIVRGFLRANVGFAEDDDVARDYLTPALASEWVPTSDVLVLDGTPEIRSTEPGVVSVTAPASARIDAEGRLVELPAGTTSTHTFRLTPVDGEWRISAFPEGFGLWLSRSDLEQAFTSSTVYYLNPVLKSFVPDLRWLARGEGLPTSLARAQLAPVPDYLAGAVVTGAPGDGRLTVTAVPVDPQTQVATVNLQGAGIGEEGAQLGALRAQLGHALLGLPGIRGVDLRVAGRTVGSSGPVTAATDLGYQDVERDVDRALLRVRDRFLVVDPTVYDLRNVADARSADVELPTLGLSWTGVAASADLDSMAAVSLDGTRLWRWHRGQGEGTVNPGIGEALTPPAFDPHGLLWVAGAARGGGAPRVWFVGAGDVDALARPLDLPDLGRDDRIRAFRVSPDGSRALLVVTADDAPGGRLLVAGIVRDTTGRPTGLAQPVDVAPTLRSVVSARWASTTELVVTGQRADDAELRGFRLPLGGWMRELGEQPGLVEVLAVPTGTTYSPVARTEDGRFHTTEGASGWGAARNGDELIVPGT